MEDLVELEDLAYDIQAIPDELVLWASLLLRGEGVFWSYTNSTDERNTKAAMLISWFADNSNKSMRQQVDEEHVWISDRLPDVCGACFFSFGLCTGGRYRWFGCPECKGKEARTLSYERRLEMQRVCFNGDINEAILCQLIYKYYSPNGDSQWHLKKYCPIS